MNPLFYLDQAAPWLLFSFGLLGQAFNQLQIPSQASPELCALVKRLKSYEPLSFLCLIIGSLWGLQNIWWQGL